MKSATGTTFARVQNTIMQGVVFDTKNKVLRFSPKDVHMVAPYTGSAIVSPAYAVSDLGRVTKDDVQLLPDLGYPICRDAPRTFGKKAMAYTPSDTRTYPFRPSARMVSARS